MTGQEVALLLGQGSETAKVEESIRRIERGDFHAGDVERVAEAGARRSISALRKQFGAKQDAILKGFIASGLVRLGVKDKLYWEFLAEQARSALESDAPSIYLLDAQGRILRGQGRLSPEFEVWAKAHGLDLGAAAQAQSFDLPIRFTHLARTGDARGRALIRRGLASRNFLIQGMAARGLAKLRDRDSIPLIVEACKRAPAPEMASWIARALVFFDDPQAQSAADMFILDKQLLSNLRQKARDKRADPFSP